MSTILGNLVLGAEVHLGATPPPKFVRKPVPTWAAHGDYPTAKKHYRKQWNKMQDALRNTWRAHDYEEWNHWWDKVKQFHKMANHMARMAANPGNHSYSQAIPQAAETALPSRPPTPAQRRESQRKYEKALADEKARKKAREAKRKAEAKAKRDAEKAAERKRKEAEKARKAEQKALRDKLDAMAKQLERRNRRPPRKPKKPNRYEPRRPPQSSAEDDDMAILDLILNDPAGGDDDWQQYVNQTQQGYGGYGGYAPQPQGWQGQQPTYAPGTYQHQQQGHQGIIHQQGQPEPPQGIQYDAQGNAFYYDENGQPIYYQVSASSEYEDWIRSRSQFPQGMPRGY